MLFIFLFKGLKRHYPPLFLSPHFIAIIDIFQMASKICLTIVIENQ